MNKNNLNLFVLRTQGAPPADMNETKLSSVVTNYFITRISGPVGPLILVTYAFTNFKV